MKFLSKLTLVKKIALLTALGLVLAVGVFSFIGMRAVNQATEAMLQDRLTTADLVADYLDESLGRALIELRDTAQAIKINEAKENIKPQIENLEDNYREWSIYINAIYLVDDQERIIWSEPDTPELEGEDMSLYPSIGQTIKTGVETISGLVLSLATDTPVVLIISPVKEGGAESKGALVAAIDIAQSSIGGFVRPIKMGHTGYAEIVDQNGIVVARTEPGPALAPFEKSDHSGRFAELIARGEPTRGVCHTCHEPVQKVERRDVLAFVPLSQAHWGVVIRQSENEALAPVHELRQNLLFFGAALIAIAFVIIVIITRDVLGRIRMLTAASKRIANGDLTSPINTAQKDEVGILAQTFEDMRSKLKKSYGELEQRTKELSSLLAVSETLASLADLSNLNTALGSALDKTLEITNQDIGGIILLDEEKQVLSYRVHRGLSQKYTRNMRLHLGEGIAGKVAQTGEAILLEDISADRRAAHPDLISAERLRAFVSIPLRSKGKILGVLNIASHQACKFSPEEVRLLHGIARQIANAVENARLHQEVQRKDEVRGELLREIFSIQEEERKRIARELHDETSQVLASLTANLAAASNLLPDNKEKAKDILQRAQDLSIRILDEIHRMIYELRPSLLDDMGLVAAVRSQLEESLRPTGIKVNFKTSGQEERLPPQIEATLFRVVQEATSNITKHAHARKADISLRFKKGTISIQVKDDGIGFDVQEAISSKERPRGLGLLGMKERVEILNGTMNIKSRPAGAGTKIVIEIPLKKEGANG